MFTSEISRGDLSQSGSLPMKSVALSLGIALVWLIAGVMSVQAADLPSQSNSPMPYKASPAPAFSWTGFYLGINGGYAGGHSSWGDPVVGADFGNSSTSGALLGGQLGYNLQMGAAVLGIETDADWMNVKGSTAGLGGVCAADGGGPCQTQQSWVGTIRAQDRLRVRSAGLPYVTGGVAYGDIQAVQPTGTTRPIMSAGPLAPAGSCIRPQLADAKVGILSPH